MAACAKQPSLRRKARALRGWQTNETKYQMIELIIARFAYQMERKELRSLTRAEIMPRQGNEDEVEGMGSVFRNGICVS